MIFTCKSLENGALQRKSKATFTSKKTDFVSKTGFETFVTLIVWPQQQILDFENAAIQCKFAIFKCMNEEV